MPSYILGILYSIDYSKGNQSEILKINFVKFSRLFLKLSIVLYIFLLSQPYFIGNSKFVALETVCTSLAIPIFIILLINYQNYYLSEKFINYFEISFDKRLSMYLHIFLILIINTYLNKYLVIFRNLMNHNIHIYKLLSFFLVMLFIKICLLFKNLKRFFFQIFY